MSTVQILRKLSLSAVVLALLSILGSMLYPNTAQAATEGLHSSHPSKKYNFSQLIGARPLWKYARAINSGSGGGSLSCLTSATLPRCYSPQQLRAAYGVQPLLDAGTTGKGHTIVLIDFSSSPTLTSDVHVYDQLFGLNDPKINVIAPFGYPAFDPGSYVETALDVEIAHALAPDATIDLVLANETAASSPNDILAFALQATKYAIDHSLGDVISQSFGLGEACVGSAYLQSEQQVFREARDKHITLLASSGDSGSGGLVCVGFFNFGQAVQLPAADPLVTSVGGTTLDADVSTGKYNSEATWNEWDQGGGATGGGISTLFPAPSYQRGISGISTARGIPDIAFDADPFTGVPIVVTEFGQTFIVPTGGTSVGSPAWAAIVALADQHAGKRLGFLNSALYRIVQSADYATGFHDITTGNNTVNFLDNQGNLVTVPGYNAGPGWDAATGVGSPIASSLVPLLAKYVKPGDGRGL